MDYRQSLGSSISGRDRQQPPIKVKKHHEITKKQKQNTQDKCSNSRRSSTISKKTRGANRSE